MSPSSRMWKGLRGWAQPPQLPPERLWTSSPGVCCRQSGGREGAGTRGSRISEQSPSLVPVLGAGTPLSQVLVTYGGPASVSPAEHLTESSSPRLLGYFLAAPFPGRQRPPCLGPVPALGRNGATVAGPEPPKTCRFTCPWLLGGASGGHLGLEGGWFPFLPEEESCSFTPRITKARGLCLGGGTRGDLVDVGVLPQDRQQPRPEDKPPKRVRMPWGALSPWSV